MMKKIVAMLLAVMMVFSLAACGGMAQESGSESETVPATQTETAQPTQASEATELPAVGLAYLDQNSNLTFRAFLELTGEELVSLFEGQGYEWYENEYVMSGFADEGKSNGFQKNFFFRYIQTYNSPSDYRSYEDIRAAGKGELANMAVAWNVEGEYQEGAEALPALFDGLETVASWKHPKYGNSIGAVRVKDDSGTEYLVVYTTEFYSGGSAVVSLICRTDAYFAANPFEGASTIEAIWNAHYSE